MSNVELDDLEPGELGFPLVFRKSAAGKPAGYITYAFLALGIAMFPGVFVAIFVAGLLWQQNYLAWYPASVVAVAIPIYGLFHFSLRRRFEGEFHVWPDRVVILEGRPRELSYEGMEILDSSPWVDHATLDLKAASGARYKSSRWHPGAAEAIRSVAVPRITQELEARLANGEEVVFREYRAKYSGRLIGLSLLLIWAVFGLMALLRKDAQYAPSGFVVMMAGAGVGIPSLWLTIKRMRRAGVRISREGILHRRAWIPWGEIRGMGTSEDGLSISHSSRFLHVASPGCANYRSLVEIVRSRLPVDDEIEVEEGWE